MSETFRQLSIVWVASILVGCQATLPVVNNSPTAPSTDIEEHTSAAVDRLVGSISLAPRTTILVASFVDLDELTTSTRLGRLIAEQAAEHLIQRGYLVPEARLTVHLQVREDGEFMLSRDPKELKLTENLGAGVVLTGTTTSIGGTTYVNLRLIRYADGIAIAAANLQLPDRLAGR